MREEVIERKFWLTRLFGIKYRYFFDSINDFLTNPHKTGIYFLQNLKVERSIPKEFQQYPYSSSTYYTFLFKDNTGDITVESYPCSMMFQRMYPDKIWQDIINIKEGQVVDIIFGKPNRTYILDDIKNRSIDEKVN